MSDPMTLPEAIEHALREKVGPVFPSDLRAHLERDAVFMVRADVDLITCGVAVATDDLERVRQWVENGQLRKPTEGERTEFSAETERTWMAIVVQPFVLIQEAADAQPTAPSA